MALISRRR